MTFFPPKISTGVCSLLFVLVLWCLSCSQLLAQRIVPFNPITGDTIPSGQPLPSFVQFRIDGLAPPRPLEGNANFPDWTYYWTFGDCKSPSLSRQPIHQYDPFDPQQTAFQVKCVLTGIYSDDDDLITFYYPSETGQFALLPVPEIHPEPAQPLLRTGRLAGIVPVRETSPEQLITYLLPYGNSNFFGEAQGQVTLEYPFEILIPANDIPESCGFTNKSFSNLGNYEAVVFDFDQLLPNETRFIPVNFRVNEGAPIGQEFDLYVDYWDDQGGTSRDTLRITLVDSQDPNEKRVDRSDACPGDRLEYTIHFENFGNGPAAQVTIIDEIDTVLQLHQFLVEGHSLADTTPLECIDSIAIDANFNPNQLPLAPGPKIFVLKDSARSKVAWVLQNIDLPPIDSAGNTGMVRYSIPLKPSAPTNWHPFGKNAAIYFDDNTPIMTQAPICVSKPCLCTPSPQNNSPYYITKVELNGEVQVSESDDGYRRFINQGWSLRQALKNEITGQFLTPQGNTRPIFWRVWLDGNRDGDFSFNELVLEQEGANITNDFLLPNNPGTGMATLRIAVQLNSYPNPCSLIHPGEIEDYEVVIEDPGLPDLRPLVAQLTAPVLIPGQLNTLVGICTNLGPASATNPTLDYYLSDDPDYDTTDLLLASTSVNLLAQGDTLPDTVQAFIPTGYQGTYYLLSIADQNNGLNENQENNNQSHRQIRVGPLLPDLTIGSAFVCEPQIRDNTSLSVAFQVRNIGATAVPAASGATAEVLVSSNPTLDNTALLVHQITLPDLGMQEISYFKTSIPVGSYAPVLPGNYFVHVRLNDDGTLNESNFQNNLKSLPVEIVAKGQVSPPYWNGFECGGLDPAWAVGPLANNVVWEDQNLAFQGSHCLILGSPLGGSGVGHADLKVIRQGQESDLSFYWIGAGNTAKPSDGLFVSNDDGTSFQKLQSLASSTPGWHYFSARLDTLDTTLGDTLILRWQFNDQSLWTLDGLGIDQLQIVDAPAGAATRKATAPVLPTEAEVKVVPNPFQGKCRLEIVVPESAKKVAYQCYNAVGNPVAASFAAMDHASGRHLYEIELTHQPPGLYFCRIQIGAWHQTLKLVKVQ